MKDGVEIWIRTEWRSGFERGQSHRSKGALNSNIPARTNYFTQSHTYDFAKKEQEAKAEKFKHTAEVEPDLFAKRSQPTAEPDIEIEEE